MLSLTGSFSEYATRFCDGVPPSGSSLFVFPDSILLVRDGLPGVDGNASDQQTALNKMIESKGNHHTIQS